MADQLDRDYELLTYNQHPFQLFAYRLHNRFLQRRNEKWEQINKGEKTVEQLGMIEAEYKFLFTLGSLWMPRPRSYPSARSYLWSA